jgi:hypothetical protein
MPQEKALQSLRRSHDLSVIEDHANAYLIKQAKNGEILGTVEFKDSKLVSASKNWGRPLSAQLASAPFANAVFEALDNVTGHRRSVCIVATRDTSPTITPYPANAYESNPVPVYPPPGAALSRDRRTFITCGNKRTVIDVGTAYSGDNSDVSVSVNYNGPVRGNIIRDYEGPIRVGNLTLDGGMPEEKALQLLKSSPEISVGQLHVTGQNYYFIADAESPALLWQVVFERSKLYSASQAWEQARSASAPFAIAVFKYLDSLTKRFSFSVTCAVETAATNPDLHDSATDTTSPTNPNDSSPVIKHVYIACGKNQVSVSIGTTASGNYSSVDMAESIFAK